MEPKKGVGLMISEQNRVKPWTRNTSVVAQHVQHVITFKIPKIWRQETSQGRCFSKAWERAN